jgi:phosphomannomutase/phosphoglucomutase
MNTLNTSIFREYDIRGLVPSELNPESMTLIAKAFGTHLRSLNLKTISVGGDVRTHTRELMDAFIAAINSTGIDVIDIGYVTSPLCYFSAFHLPVDGLAMITASHNPKNYNGVKLGVGKTTMFGAEITHIRDLAMQGDFATGAGKVTKQDITDDYIDYLGERFKLSRPIKMVLDPANATGALFAKRVFERVGADVVSIYDTVDGNFPNHHPDPTVAENVVDLGKKVVELGYEVGIGLDGDSDRVGVVDEKGELIPGDLLTLIFAKDILLDRPGSKIIYEVKSSQALEEEITKAGGVPILWKVGHSLLKKKMSEEQAPLAGEVSGHIFFGDRWFGFDDAVYAALRFLEILDKTGKKPSQLLEGTPKFYNTPEIRCGCDNDDEKFRIAKEAAAYFASKYPVIDIDGVRIQFGDGWGLVRASNTQPSLVTRFEAKTPERVEAIKNEVLGKLQELGHIQVGMSH